MIKILLADDDDLLAGMLEKKLTRTGHEVLRAGNGREALQLFHTQAVDLVLTDMMMPDMDGLQLIAELRRFHPAVKIIAMSGSGQSNLEEVLLTAQPPLVACILAKPFTGEQLQAAIQSVLAPGK